MKKRIAVISPIVKHKCPNLGYIIAEEEYYYTIEIQLPFEKEPSVYTVDKNAVIKIIEI